MNHLYETETRIVLKEEKRGGYSEIRTRFVYDGEGRLVAQVQQGVTEIPLPKYK